MSLVSKNTFLRLTNPMGTFANLYSWRLSCNPKWPPQKLCFHVFLSEKFLLGAFGTCIELRAYTRSLVMSGWYCLPCRAYLSNIRLTWLDSRKLDVATEDEIFCIVSHVGDGMNHSTAHLSNYCMSLCQLDFQISLTNSFVLATFRAPRSSNIDVGRRACSCAIISFVS